MHSNKYNKILIIQTAFIGDVILASALIEKLNQYFPEAKIDFLLRKGNETLLQNNPKINKVLIWDKKTSKYKNLFKILKQIRKEKYDLLINLQRFASSGLLTCFSNAKEKRGFDKNPFSFCFDKKSKHKINNGKHETERNQELISDITDNKANKPKLYPSTADFEFVSKYKNEKYITMAPASVWFTKQLPKEKWIELVNANKEYKVFLLGAASDYELCNEIIKKTAHNNIENLSGKLSFLQSAALMNDAAMNYVNDSAPLHIASAMNANVTAFFCSTIPEFGFGPLSDNSKILQVQEKLDCRPCGLHGFKSCPEKHFDCGFKINLKE